MGTKKPKASTPSLPATTLAADERGLVVYVGADGKPTKVIRKGLDAPLAAAALLLAANAVWNETQDEAVRAVNALARPADGRAAD